MTDSHNLSKTKDVEVKHQYWYKNITGTNEFEFTSNEMARLDQAGVMVYVETVETYFGFKHIYTKDINMWEKDALIKKWRAENPDLFKESEPLADWERELLEGTNE